MAAVTPFDVIGSTIDAASPTTSQFDPAVLSLCKDRGATVQAVDSMTLEEIFVANVQSRRELQPA